MGRWGREWWVPESPQYSTLGQSQDMISVVAEPKEDKKDKEVVQDLISMLVLSFVPTDEYLLSSVVMDFSFLWQFGYF